MMSIPSRGFVLSPDCSWVVHVGRVFKWFLPVWALYCFLSRFWLSELCRRLLLSRAASGCLLDLLLKFLLGGTVASFLLLQFLRIGLTWTFIWGETCPVWMGWDLFEVICVAWFKRRSLIIWSVSERPLRSPKLPFFRYFWIALWSFFLRSSTSYASLVAFVGVIRF